MDNLKSKLEKAENALKGASPEMKAIYQKQVDTLKKKIEEFKEEPKATEAIIETNAEIEALTKKLEKAQNSYNGATDAMKAVYEKQIKKLTEQINSSLADFKKADTVAEVKKVEEKVEKKVKEAKKTEKKVKVSASLVNSTWKKIEDLAKTIKTEGAKYKKKHNVKDAEFIDEIHDKFNKSFTDKELEDYSSDELSKLADFASKYKEEVIEIFKKETDDTPKKTKGKRVVEKKKEESVKEKAKDKEKDKEKDEKIPISEMSHEEKCAELIAKYDAKKKKAKAEKDTRKPATKAKDKTENFVESLYHGIVKLIEKGDITPKAVDTIINRLAELTIQLKALKKKM